MSRDKLSLLGRCVGIMAVAWSAMGPVVAQPLEYDVERAQRRLELRQQLQAERGRWRNDGPPAAGGWTGEPSRPAADPGRGARLSAEERRELRRELRQAPP